MPRFPFVDLLWLTLVAGMALAWWIDRQRLLAETEAVRVFLLAEVRTVRQELEQSEAYLWKNTAVRLTPEMRDNGWYVRLGADAVALVSRVQMPLPTTPK